MLSDRMALQALIVSKDPEAIGVLVPALQEIGIDFQEAENPAFADSLLQQSIFDAVLVDCDGLFGAKEIVKWVRSGNSKNSTVFAVTNGKTTMKEAFLLGANYVIEKPLDGERTRATVRSAMTTMLRERRRHTRHPLNGTATIWHGNDEKIEAKTLNISEGGLAVELPYKMEIGLPVRIEFDLPGNRHIDAKGEVAWADSDTHIGIKLLFMSAGARHDLDNWLVDRLIEAERKQPQFWTNQAK